jgi:lysophospholipid acyltransferase (LPLAT)-like uncharacterized protein
MLAQLSGAAVVPMACAARAGWRLRTWDRMLLPRPWTRVAVVMGKPYTVPKGLSEDQLEAERAALERRLGELGAEARGRVGR